MCSANLFIGELNNNDDEKHIMWKNDENMILSSPFLLELFQRCDEVFLDGTFHYRPQGYQQLYRVFGLIEETVCVPIFTLIMSGQTENDYQTVFNEISKLIDDEPIFAHTAHFDHEIAAVKAFRRTLCFLNTQPKMCVFHTRQALHRRVVSFCYHLLVFIYESFSKTKDLQLHIQMKMTKLSSTS